MKRDDDLIRSLLFEMEGSESSLMYAPAYMSMSVDDEKRIYHLKLLCDARFVFETSSGVYRLTNDGHDYLEAIRSNAIWEKTKDGAAAVGGMTLGLMRDVAVAYLKQEVQEKLGINL